MPVELHELGAWQLAGPQGDERLKADGRERDAECAADHGQHRALGEALSQELATSRAESGAQGQLAMSRDGTCKKKTRDIGTRDEQHQENGAEEQPERGPDVAD